MNRKDVRWQQRFQNYRQALARLTEAVVLSHQRALSDLEKQGLIQELESRLGLECLLLHKLFVEPEVHAFFLPFP